MNSDRTPGRRARTGAAHSAGSDQRGASSDSQILREQRVAPPRLPTGGRGHLDEQGDAERTIDATDRTSQPASRTRRAVPWLTAAIVTTAATLLTVATVSARAEIRDLQEAARDQDAAITVAQNVCDLLLNLRAETAAADLDSMRQAATGDFAAQLQTLDSAVGAILKQGDVRASGAIASAGIDTFSPRRATVLVAARTVITNTEIPNGEPRDFRIEVTLARNDQRWKVSAVEFLS